MRLVGYVIAVGSSSGERQILARKIMGSHPSLRAKSKARVATEPQPAAALYLLYNASGIDKNFLPTQRRTDGRGIGAWFWDRPTPPSPYACAPGERHRDARHCASADPRSARSGAQYPWPAALDGASTAISTAELATSSRRWNVLIQRWAG